MTDLLTVLSKIDLDAVGAAVTAYEPDERPLPDFDVENCKELIWKAAERWLLRDLEEFTLDSVEEEQYAIVAGHNFKYIMDLAGKVKGIHEPFTPYAGKTFCIDWKTSRNTLDAVWKQRLIDSWQWKLYHYCEGIDLFLYRGLSRNGDLKEVIISPPETTLDEVYEYVDAVGEQLVVLQEYEVWPRNAPYACNAFGRECSHKAECDNYTMPRAKVRKDHISYSFLTTFMLCQEKARRYALKQSNDSSEETTFGRCCHRGLASLWRQAFETSS